MFINAIRITRYFFALVLLAQIISCKSKSRNQFDYPTGNAVKDYFYKHSYSYPFYCDSLKPICKTEDAAKGFGKYQNLRAKLAMNASEIIKSEFKIDSLVHNENFAFALFPVYVYYIDSPVIWYRVVFKEYKNNITKEKSNTNGFQLIDSNRIQVLYHNLEFEVKQDGSLEYKCENL